MMVIRLSNFEGSEVKRALIPDYEKLPRFIIVKETETVYLQIHDDLYRAHLAGHWLDLDKILD